MADQQLKPKWYTLWMPTGSVRGLVFLMMAASVCYGAVFSSIPWAQEALKLGFTAVIGFYFGAKSKEVTT